MLYIQAEKIYFYDFLIIDLMKCMDLGVNFDKFSILDVVEAMEIFVLPKINESVLYREVIEEFFKNNFFLIFFDHLQHAVIQWAATVLIFQNQIFEVIIFFK